MNRENMQAVWRKAGVQTQDLLGTNGGTIDSADLTYVGKYESLVKHCLVLGWLKLGVEASDFQKFWKVLIRSS